MKLGTLFALAFVAVAASCAATDDRPDETLGTQELGATCTCPLEAQTGSCGKWTCLISRGGNICTFGQLQEEGEKCMLDTETGRCSSPSGDPKADLVCCPGCFTPGERDVPGVCHPGDENGYCGTLGLTCDACKECETCESGKCVPTTGNSCGTCQSCSDGACKPDDVGTACTGGRCAEGAICCTGCINGSGQCVSSTDSTCGTGGGDCKDCGQCGACSAGSCDATTGGGCDDSDPCTENDTCGMSGCAGTQVATDDGNECTDDACSAQDGITHTSRPEGDACVGTGNSCGSGGWHCTDHDVDPGTPRVCQPVMGLTCNDDNPCTDDAPDCSGAGSCPFPDVDDDTACTNGLRCVLNESCQGGECVGEMRNCSDDNPCTTDSCEETDGAGIDPVTGCKHAPKSMSTTCDDGNGCTDSDHCGADGQCAGMLIACEAVDECHTAGTCDPQTGACSDQRVPDGSGCEGTGVCKAGKCQGGTPTGTGGTSGTGGGGTGGGTSGASGASGSPGGDGNEAGSTSSVAGSDGNPGSGGSGTGGTGGTGKGGSGGGSSGASGASASGGDSAGTFDGPPFQRDPGGCSCEVGGERSPAGSYVGLALVGGLGLVMRRRRRAA
jgi:MYXO-CTERM domain-containing protein